MATALFPFDAWTSQITQASVPANNNALRAEVLAAQVISKTTTAQPASPTSGDLYIIPAGATGAQWATFTAGDLAIYKSGTWYAYAPYTGQLKVVAGAVEMYSSGWAPIATKAQSYTVAGVPSASTTGAGTMIYVSNESGGAVLAFSDGTNWLRVTDRAVIS